jgi:hypothetical protein
MTGRSARAQRRGRLARSLVKSLSTAQRTEAVLNAAAPGDILTSNQRKAAIQDDKGVAYSPEAYDCSLAEAVIEGKLDAMRLRRVRKHRSTPDHRPIGVSTTIKCSLIITNARRRDSTVPT